MEFVHNTVLSNITFQQIKYVIVVQINVKLVKIFLINACHVNPIINVYTINVLINVRMAIFMLRLDKHV